ncbi:SLIT-ROBO Rho GTPase-activating protein 3 [Crotalus adamanteus]|uniref:SLIT-ROBO Rho GTPase-activating protein 3 n=1 Tax=Crotalus adamanteus TaxID=8729 RepID=A0AAW1BX48_CROAD
MTEANNKRKAESRDEIQIGQDDQQGQAKNTKKAGKLLVEQFKCLEQQSESRLQLLQDLQEFFRRKAEIELEYSRNLEKLAERFSSKIRSSREHHQFKKDQHLLSPVNCWYLVLTQTRRESRDHATLNDIFMNNVIVRLSQISEDVIRLFKKSKEIGLQMHEELLKVTNELYTVMKTYHMYHAESISAESKLKEAEKQEEKQFNKAGDISVNLLRHEDRPQRRSSVKKIEKMKEKVSPQSMVSASPAIRGHPGRSAVAALRGIPALPPPAVRWGFPGPYPAWRPFPSVRLRGEAGPPPAVRWDHPGPYRARRLLSLVRLRGEAGPPCIPAGADHRVFHRAARRLPGSVGCRPHPPVPVRMSSSRELDMRPLLPCLLLKKRGESATAAGSGLAETPLLIADGVCWVMALELSPPSSGGWLCHSSRVCAGSVLGIRPLDDPADYSGNTGNWVPRLAPTTWVFLVAAPGLLHEAYHLSAVAVECLPHPDVPP